MKLRFFRTPAALRKWFEKHHQAGRELTARFADPDGNVLGLYQEPGHAARGAGSRIVVSQTGLLR